MIHCLSVCYPSTTALFQQSEVSSCLCPSSPSLENIFGILSLSFTSPQRLVHPLVHIAEAANVDMDTYICVQLVCPHFLVWHSVRISQYKFNPQEKSACIRLCRIMFSVYVSLPLSLAIVCLCLFVRKRDISFISGAIRFRVRHTRLIRR